MGVPLSMYLVSQNLLAHFVDDMIVLREKWVQLAAAWISKITVTKQLCKYKLRLKPFFKSHSSCEPLIWWSRATSGIFVLMMLQGRF